MLCYTSSVFFKCISEQMSKKVTLKDATKLKYFKLTNNANMDLNFNDISKANISIIPKQNFANQIILPKKKKKNKALKTLGKRAKCQPYSTHQSITNKFTKQNPATNLLS